MKRDITKRRGIMKKSIAKEEFNMENKFELKMEDDFTVLGLETGHEYKVISPNKQGETGVYGI